MTFARTLVGRGAKILLGDPGSELRLGRVREKEKREDDRWYERYQINNNILNQGRMFDSIVIVSA